MENHEELISRRLTELAGEAGPLTADEPELMRRVLRRRAIQNGSVVAAAMAVTAGAVLLPQALSGSGTSRVAADAAPATAKYCGATRRVSPSPIDPRASSPAGQEALDTAAGTVERIAGAGKAVIKGGAPPGAYARWYGGVAISSEWHSVIVYRLPNPALDQAICAAIHDVTVELRPAVRSEGEAQDLASRIINNPPKQVKIFSVAADPDGRVEVSTDNVALATKALTAYGPYLVIKKGQPVRAGTGDLKSTGPR